MSGYDVNTAVPELINAISETIKNLKTLNIIIAGKTGAGKSTLINAVFKEHLADTGMGKPVTTHMRKITKKDIPLVIYDTRGLELGKEVQADVKREVMETIHNGLAEHDINKAIHCIWYCINTASNRIEPEEVEWLRELSTESRVTQVPVVVILTQSFSQKKAEAMKRTLLNENLDIISVVPVLAEDYEIDGLGTAKSFGLDNLIKVMGEVLPEELMDTLQHVQIACLEEKKRRSQAAVKKAALAAASAGAVPIPFSDCALLIPTQMTMIAYITAIFGFDVNKSVITALLSSTIGAGGATLLGKTAVSNILKLIPGAGSIAGGAVSAGTAGVITAALGEAYIAIMEKVFRGEMNLNDLATKKGKEEMAALYKDRLLKQR